MISEKVVICIGHKLKNRSKTQNLYSLSKISKMNFCKVWPWSPLCMRCACACVPYVLGKLTKAKCTIPNNPRHIVSSYVANFVVNHKTFFHWNGAYKFHSWELESQLHCWSRRKETRIFKSFQFTSMPGKWKFDLFFKWFSCILILMKIILRCILSSKI